MCVDAGFGYSDNAILSEIVIKHSSINIFEHNTIPPILTKISFFYLDLKYLDQITITINTIKIQEYLVISITRKLFIKLLIYNRKLLKIYT